MSFIRLAASVSVSRRPLLSAHLKHRDARGMMGRQWHGMEWNLSQIESPNTMNVYFSLFNPPLKSHFRGINAICNIQNNTCHSPATPSHWVTHSMKSSDSVEMIMMMMTWDTKKLKEKDWITNQKTLRCVRFKPPVSLSRNYIMQINLHTRSHRSNGTAMSIERAFELSKLKMHFNLQNRGNILIILCLSKIK